MHWLEFIGETCDVLGKVLIALTAITVHDTIQREHHIDAAVGKSIRKEHVFGFLGIFLIVLGYLLRQIAKYG